ncbi:MAG TPA: DUF721 domain-containing protein [Planctomycetota bacterium]|nr:DUF721 domain-containing protein [Planctomycetota bacterium]
MKQPKPVAELVSGILRDLGQNRRRQALQDALAEAVGASAAPWCRVAGLRAGQLVVEVASAPLFAELRGFRADEIRQAINAALGRPEVASILFRMGGTANV